MIEHNRDVELPRPENTQKVFRGTCLHLSSHDYRWCPEFRVKSGRRIDVFGLSGKGVFWAIEIKSSLEDFRADTKWPEYLAFCDLFSFAVGPQFPIGVLPPEVGLIITDGYEHFEKRKPMKTGGLSGAARKSLLIQFARTTAARAHRLNSQITALGATPEPSLASEDNQV